MPTRQPLDERVSSLLQERKELWLRFHKLRRVNPILASIARRGAIKIEQELAELGMTSLSSFT